VVDLVQFYDSSELSHDPTIIL